MYQDNSNVDHFVKMISGCESINDHIANRSPLTEDGLYAYSSLKFEANQAGLHSGSEGFMDFVKKSAGSIKEWFLKLVKAIFYFLDEITGQNAKRRKIEAEIERFKRDAKAHADGEAAYNARYLEAAKAVFSEPTRLTTDAFEEMEKAGYIDAKMFKSLDVGNLDIARGYSAIKSLISVGEHPDTRAHKDIFKYLEDLHVAISGLSRKSKTSVGRWVEEDEASEMRSDIRAAGAMLTRFTKILKWWNDGLNRFYDQFGEIGRRFRQPTVAGQEGYEFLTFTADHADLYDGTEGFLDTIKKGAASAKEFIELVIKTIIDAVLMYVGGRDNFNKLIKKFKNSAAVEVFKSNVQKAADNEFIPAMEKALEISEQVVNDYQPFYRKDVEETNDIKNFYIENNKVQDLLGKSLRKLKSSPSEDDIIFSDITQHINSVVDLGKRILTSAKKDPEENQKAIRLISSSIGKYHRILSILGSATGRAAKYFKQSEE